MFEKIKTLVQSKYPEFYYIEQDNTLRILLMPFTNKMVKVIDDVVMVLSHNRVTVNKVVRLAKVQDTLVLKCDLSFRTSLRDYSMYLLELDLERMKKEYTAIQLSIKEFEMEEKEQKLNADFE